jgi:ubiquinone/menaquinone biosynthesis C-methylase UbiE
MIKSNKKDAWDKSYINKDNYMFYPQEDVIRFISKYITKRIGLEEFSNKNNSSDKMKVLDFGCGIGRHVRTLNEFNIDGYGFDLSSEAINVAKQNFKELGLVNLVEKVIVADITKLPYKDNHFDFMLSHGVLDSMPYSIAKDGLLELSRCLKDNGKMYIDLISEIGYDCSDSFEKTIQGNHEKNTIQTYFNEDRIDDLIKGVFMIEEIILKSSFDILNKKTNARYHIVISKL